MTHQKIPYTCELCGKDYITHVCNECTQNEKINRIMRPIHDMADLCEEAHNRTKEECERLGISFEYKHTDSDGEVMLYYPKAQAIFDRHYDQLVAEYNI